MYERFSDRARKVMKLADAQARDLRHTSLDAEHLLLGLVNEGSGVAANVLHRLGVNLRKVRWEVEELLPTGPEPAKAAKLRHTPRAKKVIERSMEEARSLGHNYVGTEHILLGLLCEEQGVVGRVLASWGLQTDPVREQIAQLSGTKPNQPGQGGSADPSWMYRLGQCVRRMRCTIRSWFERTIAANLGRPSPNRRAVNLNP